MSAVVDYIVYMTYDLHCQWDYGNANLDPGCPGGNCLCSHVNLTETLNSLSMITKAGVPTNKIVVGVSSYGRSFQMTTPGCTGPMCTYTGTTSGAQPAPCTNTRGTSDWAVDLQKLYPPTNSTTPQPGLKGYGAVDPTIQYCTGLQAKILRQSWIDAGTMAKLHMQWSPNGKWQNVMDLYMGNGSRNDSPVGHDYDFGPIGTNIEGEYLIHFVRTGNSPFWTYGWLYCGDTHVTLPNGQKLCQEANPPIAYSWDEPKWFWTAHYIAVADLAYWKGSDVARLNAESFADCAMSMYIMDTWGHTTPPTPNDGAYVPGQPPGTLTAATNDALPAPPTGWTSPVNINSTTFTWDPNLDVIVMSTLGDTQDDSTK
ncbi:glycoside hydrolase superfamily [Halenospora varia]|nr:glycoside hydrolase superfamily [Halenospora varia]